MLKGEKINRLDYVQKMTDMFGLRLYDSYNL